jgi:hypothetical protein
MDIEIQQAFLEDKTILRNLLELYVYDFSEFDQSDVDVHGLYGYERLDHYWTEPERHPFIIRVGAGWQDWHWSGNWMDPEPTVLIRSPSFSFSENIAISV